MTDADGKPTQGRTQALSEAMRGAKWFLRAWHHAETDAEREEILVTVQLLAQRLADRALKMSEPRE